MGLWWEGAKKVPEGGISIKGEPSAWPKCNPLWRFQHKWMIFDVEIEGPYYVYFDDGVDRMCCRKIIETKHFAARIGPRDLRFSAVTDLSDPESLTITEHLNGYRCNWFRIHYFSNIYEITLI